MNGIIISKALNISNKDALNSNKSNADASKKDDNLAPNQAEEPKNKGKLQIDATIVGAKIKYPTDLGLLNDAREKSETIIDILCLGLKIEIYRTYRIQVRKKWLNFSKKKSKNYNEIRIGVGQQFNYFKRNLKNISKTVD